MVVLDLEESYLSARVSSDEGGVQELLGKLTKSPALVRIDLEELSRPEVATSGVYEDRRGIERAESTRNAEVSVEVEEVLIILIH